MKNKYTSVYTSDNVRVDLFTSAAFRVRFSHLSGEKFPEKYEIPFSMSKDNNWEKVDYTMDLTYGTSPCVVTDMLKIYVPYGNKIIVENLRGERLYPIDMPQYGMFVNHCIVYDAASFHQEHNECSRFSHWFYNEKTDLYDTNLPEDEMLDVFFIYSQSYKEGYNLFNKICGAEPMLNKKGYGFYQTQHLASRGTQSLIMKTASTFRERDIPCDTLIIDYEWGDGADGAKEYNWGTRLDWSSEYKKPLSPQQMIAELKKMNFDVMLIHHSIPDYVGRTDEAWVCQPENADLWWQKMKELIDIGVCGTWQDTRKSDITNARIYHGIQKLLGKDKRCTFLGNYEMYRDCCWTVDSYILPKLQRLGSRRTPYFWTGDMAVDKWEELKFQIKAIANFHGALKGYSYITNDCMRVGGRKMAVRSGQFLCFNGIVRSHNVKPWQKMVDTSDMNENMAIINADAEIDKAKMTDDELLGLDNQDLCMQNLIAKFLKIRYRLIPYIYTFAREAFDTGLPITRPLMVAFENDENCNENQYPMEYMFGSQILVCPVYEDTDKMDVYLPNGEWIDFFTGEKYAGKQTVSLDVSSLEYMPLFVKNGGILPMGEEKCYIDNEQDDTLYLNVFGKENGEFTLYLDDGHSLDYKTGKCCFIKITSKLDADKLNVEIHPSCGEYKPKKQKVILSIDGGKTVSAEKTVDFNIGDKFSVSI